MSRVIVMAALVLGAVAGCASGRPIGSRGPEIKDEWIARVPEGELGPVRDARSDLRAAEDEANRYKVAVSDARRELGVQKSLRDASKARGEAAQKQVEAAQATGDQSQLEQARSALESARARDEVAQARVEVFEGRVQVAEDRHELAQGRLATARARLERAEYQVLNQRNDTRISRIAPGEFDREVERLELRERELQGKIEQSEQRVTASERNLRDKQQQLGVGGAGVD